QAALVDTLNDRGRSEHVVDQVERPVVDVIDAGLLTVGGNQLGFGGYAERGQIGARKPDVVVRLAMVVLAQIAEIGQAVAQGRQFPELS
ncbi:MAG: hypothetical protein ACKN9T_19330, partial [Candidatus Methylumidiphilus sp.]